MIFKVKIYPFKQHKGEPDRSQVTRSSVWKFSFRDKIFKGIKFLTENEFPSSPKHQKFIKNKFEVDVEVHFPGKTLLTVSIECNHASGWGGRTLQMFA